MVDASKVNFVRQQGFANAEPASCPARFPALMFQPWAVGSLVVVGLATQWGPWFLGLGVVLWWSALVPKANPFDAIHNALLAGRKGRPRLAPAPTPRRFSQAMGGTFNLAIGAALVAGMRPLAWGIEAALVAALAALLLGRFCLGSWIYHLLTGNAAFASRTLPWSRAD